MRVPIDKTRGSHLYWPRPLPKSPACEGCFIFSMTKPSIRPLLDNVLIEPIEKEQQLPSGIVIPDTAKEKPQEGTVVAVGPGKMDHGQLMKPDVKVGDHVLYKRYGGDELKDAAGKEYLMVSSDDILAVIES